MSGINYEQVMARQLQKRHANMPMANKQEAHGSQVIATKVPAEQCRTLFVADDVCEDVADATLTMDTGDAASDTGCSTVDCGVMCKHDTYCASHDVLYHHRQSKVATKRTFDSHA